MNSILSIIVIATLFAYCSAILVGKVWRQTLAVVLCRCSSRHLLDLGCPRTPLSRCLDFEKGIRCLCPCPLVVDIRRSHQEPFLEQAKRKGHPMIHILATRITKEVCKVLRSGIAHPRGILIDGRVL